MASATGAGRTVTQATAKDRLAGWAAIGGYIGRDARTAQRYERERGLPVRRMPGGGRSTFFALRAELDAWLLKQAGDDASQQELPRPAQTEPARFPATPATNGASPVPYAPDQRAVHSRPVVITALAALLCVCVVLGMGRWGRLPQAQAHSIFDDRAAAAFGERTPSGLARAIDDYTQAVIRDPKDAAGFAGLADSYNLAPEIIGTSPAEAFPKAQAAAQRAVALNPRSAAAHRALGFALFWWGQQAGPADIEFKEALKLDPSSALTHHWYANTLGARGDPAAIVQIDRAMMLDPSPAIMVDKGWILAMLGRDAEAADWVSEALKIRPDLAAAHAQLGLLRRRAGDPGGALEEGARAAELQGDAQEANALRRAASALQSKGQAQMLEILDAYRRASLVDAKGSAFLAAITASDLRRRDVTLEYLRQAKAARDPAVMSLRISPDFAWLRSDGRFQKLLPS